MADFSKNISRWIDGLTKDQFDEFIKVFIKDFFKADTVEISDGKGDGGIDAKIIELGSGKKIPLQLTIDSNVYKKLEKDLVKIGKLIEDYDYSSTFYFFYSKGAAESNVIKLVDTAERNFTINLKVFDNKLLATYLDKPDFFNSKNKLIEILGNFFTSAPSEFSENDKLYFDLIHHNSNSNELKEQFIHAFILNEFFICTKASLGKVEISQRLEDEFNLQNSDYYCEKVLQTLLTKTKIEKVGGSGYKLSTDERRNLENIKKDSDLLEKEFLSKLQLIISRYNSKVEIRILVDKLYKIFKKSNEIDLNEINENYDGTGAQSEVHELYTYIKDSFLEKEDVSVFTKEIFELCSINDFIIKVSAGKLYKELINSTEFDNYARRMQKEIFLDTPVLIYLLMVMKDPDFEYENYRFQIAKNLFSFIQTSDEIAVYNTIEPYMIELADYVSNTIKLIPIYDSGLLESLGGSSNEMVNFFVEVKFQGLFNGSFEEFIADFGISINRVKTDQKNEYLQQYLIKLFKDNHINVDEVHKYDTDYKTRAEYQRVSQTLGEIYSRTEINRKPRSLKFDSLLFMHIYQLDELTDPTVLTWDNTFKDFRSEYQSKNPNLRYWHLFKPGKYLDHISLLRFRINGRAISNEILAMIETEFEIVKGVRKLADLLSSIIDLRSASGTKLTRGLAEMRDLYVYEINKEDETKEIDSADSLPMDEIIATVIDYYTKHEGEFTLENFSLALKDDEAVEEILQLLKVESGYFMKYGKYSEDFRTKFDEVIRKYLTAK